MRVSPQFPRRQRRLPPPSPALFPLLACQANASAESQSGRMLCCSCRSVQELSAKLRIKRVALQSDFGVCFRPFFAWLFEMGRKITAMNSGACPTVVRSVPCKEGLQLMGAVLGSWPLLPKFIQFCETVFLTPFSKDLWMQIGRFVEMVHYQPLCIPVD